MKFIRDLTVVLALFFTVTLAYKELAYNHSDVKADIRTILLNPKADDGNYGPFLIRLAWHCAGTYRRTDGRGGCDGARIRFDPERTWADNAGLIPGPHADPKTMAALDLLAPTKKKYGNNLSWGDLIVLAGSTAIEEMNGPQIDFCGGRVDVYEGYSIEELDVNMIYVNAGDTSADDVREKFDKMDMNDQETVALIGGGHAFGRCHASRSGFDGQWTTNPSMFSNEWFTLITEQEYAPSANISGQFETELGGNTYIMLHGDIVLLDDPSYRDWIDIYADDEDRLADDFKAAWEKLMNRDMGLRPCAGTIPTIPETGVDYGAVKEEVLAILPSTEADSNTWGPLFVRLGWHCSGTYRETDHIGGCNGARIRHNPESSWGENIDLDIALNLLQPIYDQFQPGLSWSDLIIIASTTALESMGALPMPFCPGRTDVTAEVAAQQSKNLDEAIYLNAETATAEDLRESMKIMGFTEREMVVLNGGGHSIGQCHVFRSGFQGPWTLNPAELNNQFFQLLLERDWEVMTTSANRMQYMDTQSGLLMMLFSDMIFRDDDKFRAIVEEYAYDNDLFLADFRDAWLKLVNADRFGDVCLTQGEEMVMSSTSTNSPKPVTSGPELPSGVMPTTDSLLSVKCESSRETSVSMWIFMAILFIIILLLLALIFRSQPQPQSKSDAIDFGVEMTKTSSLQDMKTEQLEKIF